MLARAGGSDKSNGQSKKGPLAAWMVWAFLRDTPPHPNNRDTTGCGVLALRVAGREDTWPKMNCRNLFGLACRGGAQKWIGGLGARWFGRGWTSDRDAVAPRDGPADEGGYGGRRGIEITDERVP